MPNPTDIAFSPAVRAQQEAKGSAKAYAGMQMADEISADLRAFIESRDSVYLATASADGQPYIQHRGGPPGFLTVLDARTIAFADYRGNRQYVTLGNLSENPKAYLFLMDYENRQRIKIWGTAEISEDDALIAKLMPEGYRAKPERAILFRVGAWDANCPQHIPRKLDAAAVAAAIGTRDRRIAELEAELAQLRPAD